MATIGFGAFAEGRRFRFYSFATLLVLLVAGALTAFDARHIAVGEPTLWVGAAERINIGAYLLWVAVLAISLLRGEQGTGKKLSRAGERGSNWSGTAWASR
jgi:hypothetical protein